MLSIETIITFFGSSVLLSLAPGPDNIFVLTQSAVNGARAGILVTLGLCSGLIFHTLAVGLGFAAVLKANPTAFTVLKLLGGGYLLYLAYLSFLASPKHIESAEKIPFKKLYFRGVLMNITNPKVSIFFLAYLPQFLNTARTDVFYQTLILGFLFMISALVVFTVIATMAGKLGNQFQKDAKVQIILNRIAGFVFALLGIRLLI